MKVFVTVGYFDEVGDGSIFELDTRDGSVREVLRFHPPEHLRVPRKGFTGVSWLGAPGKSDLLVCGAAAIYRFDSRSLEHSGTLSLPSFNDLHGLFVDSDRIYVANTGLDCIDVFSTSGDFVGSHSFEASWVAALRQDCVSPGRNDHPQLLEAGWGVGPEGFRPQLVSGAYYNDDPALPFRRRKVRDFWHPNHVRRVGDRLLVTSFHREEVIDVFSWRVAFKTDSLPHDGQVHGGELFVTCVDGYVEAHSLDGTGKRRLEVAAETGVSGWCRGLHVTDELLAVGFTEIREPPRERWEGGDYRETSTAVVCLERATGQEVARFDLGHPERHTKVFALVEAP